MPINLAFAYSVAIADLVLLEQAAFATANKAFVNH